MVKSNKSNKAKQTKSTTKKSKTTKAKAKEKYLLSKKGQELMSKVKKPTFNQKKPTDPGSYKSKLSKPTLKQVSIPSVLPKPVKPKLGMDLVDVTKYEYAYGIKDIQVDYVEYIDKGIYVSKPINVDGNVVELSLDATEEHPLFNDVSMKAADRQTSIEYYIASTGTNPNPGLEDWYPILPKNNNHVRSEFLMFKNKKTASLRFPANITKNIVVYKNGVALKKEDWSIVEAGYAIQLTSNRTTTAVYTIDYYPNQDLYDPWNVDIYQKAGVPVKQVDVFPNGTNHNKTIELSRYPFVDFTEINQNNEDYEPFKVNLRNASIVGKNRKKYQEVYAYDKNDDSQEVFTKNVTDYKNNNVKDFNYYSIVDGEEYGGFEYKQNGKKLIFSETFNRADMYTNYEDAHGNAEIEVEYKYLSSEFRVKIILRKMSNNTMSLTPILHDYSLNFKTIK